MFRKTYQLTFVLILNALSCLAQSGLVFDRPAWDFGTIRETDGPVTHRFVCRNEGEHPEVILQVTTTCGCTTPRYTRKPILPGEEAEITVTYDPANRPGNFSRKLAVRRPPKSSIPSTAATDCDSKTIFTLSPIFITAELRSLPSDMPTFRTNP